MWFEKTAISVEAIEKHMGKIHSNFFSRVWTGKMQENMRVHLRTVATIYFFYNFLMNHL